MFAHAISVSWPGVRKGNSARNRDLGSTFHNRSTDRVFVLARPSILSSGPPDEFWRGRALRFSTLPAVAGLLPNIFRSSRGQSDSAAARKVGDEIAAQGG